MRWLAIALVGACSFSPGSVTTGDGGNGSDGPGPIDAAFDSAVTSPDAAPDAPDSPIKVRAIDVVDVKVSGGPHADFPLLVSLTETWLRQAPDGDVAGAQGFDIHFSADQDGAAELAHEVERYDATTGTLVAWVKVPQLAATTRIYLHYGDAAITTSQQQVTAVWSASYELVQHMHIIGDSTSKNMSVSTSSLTGAPGHIYNAQSFDGTSSSFDLNSATAVDDVFANGGTVETWYYARSYGEGGFGRFFSKGHTNGFSIYIDDTNRNDGVTMLHGSTGGSFGFGLWASDAVANPLDTWHHLAVVYTSGSAANVPVFYLDGAELAHMELATPAGTMLSDEAADLYLGSNDGTTRVFDGILDEMRMSSTARSAAWLATQFANQSAPSAFYTISAPL